MTVVDPSHPSLDLAIEDVPKEEREQLRLALALNGGVSLAIWIGGVCTEVNRLVREQGPWGEALAFVQSTARVDVMAGASAGGINGALLAMSLAHDQDLAKKVRSVWLDDASLAALFRSPFSSKPPSLLKGDEYFLERLKKVFSDFVTSTPTGREERPMHLMMTGTLLTGERVDFEDDFGETIHDVTHSGLFTFRRNAREDDFEGHAEAERLALAARATASFPGAFEASFIPVREGEGASGVDMEKPASFASSRFVVDGGVLVNKPLGPVLRTIFDMPADRQVRRVLAYVVPDPGAPARPQADTVAAPPSMAKVIASAVTLPRQESISLELEEIRRHNRKVSDLRTVREIFLAQARDQAEALAAEFFPAYRRSRIENTVDYFMDQLTIGIRRIDAERGRPAERWSRPQLAEALQGALAQRIDDHFPGPEEPLRWAWDVKTVELVGGLVMDVLRRGLRLTLPGDEAPWPDLRLRLRGLRKELSGYIDELREIRLSDVNHWRGLGEKFWNAGREELPRLADEAVRDWLDVALRDLKAVPERMVELLTRALPALEAVCAACEPIESAAAGKLHRALNGLKVEDTSHGPDDRLLRRLLAMAVVQQAMTAGQAPLDQWLSVIQISAETPNGFDRRRTAEEKVAGVQLGHFGAFYKRSWRANDWMWGRIDGAQRLAQVVLSPERIRRLAQGANVQDPVEHVWTRMKRLALGPPGSMHDELARQWNPTRAREEIERLLKGEPGPGGDGRKNPRRGDVQLKECTTALARRVQLEVIAEELPHVAHSIEHDRQEERAFVTPSARQFSDAVRRALDGGDSDRAAGRGGGRAIEATEVERDRGTTDGRLPPHLAVELFGQCQVGRERITGDVGSDLFTNTASKAAAVAVSAAYAKRSGLGPLRSVLSSLRSFVLAFYVLATSATGRSKTLFALLLTLLASGGAIVAYAIVQQRLGGPFFWAGAVLVVAGLALGLMRAGPWWLFVLVVATAALALGAYAWLGSLDAPFLKDIAPAATVVVIVVGSILLGVLSEGALGWLPPNSRAAAGVAGTLLLGAALGFSLWLGWPGGVLAASALLFGLLLGWALPYARPERVRAGSLALGRALARGWRRAERAGERLSIAATVIAGVGFTLVMVHALLQAVQSRWLRAATFLGVGALLGLAAHLVRWRRESWVRVHPASGGGETDFTLRWPSHRRRTDVVFDIEVRSPGRQDFMVWRSDERQPSVTFRLRDLPGGAPGPYVFRARRRRAGRGRHWGWALPVKVTITREDGRAASVSHTGVR